MTPSTALRGTLSALRLENLASVDGTLEEMGASGADA
jgi:hypothetical protein